MSRRMVGHQHKAIYLKEKEKEVAAIRYLEGVRLSRYGSIDNQVPSTDESKAKVPDSAPDSDRTPDDSSKNAPNNSAALKMTSKQLSQKMSPIQTLTGLRMTPRR